MLTEKERIEKADIIVCVLFSFYIFLSFFEVYIQQYLGPINRFFMLMMAGVLLVIYGFKLELNTYTIYIALWFGFKCISIIWSDHSNSQEVSVHLASQIGIIIMTAVLSGIIFNKRVLGCCIKSLYFFSFLYGVLSLFFSRPYRGVFTGRQVLTLFYAQNDPNNNAAFLIIAVSIALYSIVYEHRKVILNTVVIMVNSYAIFMTGSRTGFLSLAVTAVVIMLIYPFRKKEFGKKDNTLFWILFIAVIGIALVYLSRDYLPSNIRERLLAFDEYEEGSGRADKWENALRLFLENPFFGKGWGGYVLEGVNEGSIHNTFITSLCDIGIFGTLLLLFPIIYILIQAKKNKDGLAIVVLINGLFFSLTLDAINKRFFWNAIYISIMLLNYDNVCADPIKLWNEKEWTIMTQESKCKYIR